MIVTIDGPAGSGKSTAARGLAKRLGFEFLDTGAMYRCVGCAVLSRELDPHNEQAVVEVSRQIKISFADNRVLLDGADVTDAIRTGTASDAASVVAQYPDVRSELVRLQQQAALGVDMVTEGRDQGTVVFPEAFCKFFLIADPEERAKRRNQELIEKGKPSDYDAILAQIHERDQRDEQRTVAPLKKADDAIEVNTSRLSIDEVIDLLEQKVRERMV